MVDLRNIYRPEDIARHGFVYQSVGPGPKPPGGPQTTDTT